MARIHRYTKGKVTLSDTLVGTDVENQKATVNVPIAAIVDLAIDYFSVNGNGDGINQSLLDITTSLDGNTTAIATYQNIVNTHTSEIESITTRTETLESTFETNEDGTLTISAANISNFAETIASEGFAQATTVDSLSSQVQQIIDGQLTIDTYATIDQLAQTTSTLEGSIALLEDTLTAGYQSYADGIIQTDSFATAVSGIVAEAGSDFSQSSQWTNLQSSFGTFNADGTLNTLSDAFANDVLSTYTGPDLATAQSVTDLGAEFGTFDANGNLTGLSSALASEITTTIAGEGYATSSDLSTLESTLTSYIDGEIASSSTAGITGSQLTTVLADYALAQTVTDLNAQIFDANGNVIDAFATSLLQTTAGNGVATAQSVTDLTATVNGNTANVATNQSAIADIDGNLSAAYGITVDAGGNIAGMQLLSDSNTGSSISFNSDVFTINVNGTDVAPFVVTSSGIALNGQVTFSNASTGQGIDFDDLSNYLTQNNYTTTGDLPDTSSFLDETALQTYLDDQGYQVGAGMDAAQLATYLTNGGYITTSTTINGGQISTGIIASGNYQHATTPTEGFSDQGMAINLDNGSIHAEQFYINNDGSANFGGAHSAGSIGSWVVDSNGALKSSASSPNIALDPNGNYNQSGSEEILISSSSLNPITPVGYVNLTTTSNSGTLSKNSTNLQSNGNILFSDFTFYDNTNAADNIPYTVTSPSVDFVMQTYEFGYPILSFQVPIDLVGTSSQYDIGYTDSQTGEPVYPGFVAQRPVNFNLKATAEFTFTITRPNGYSYTEQVNSVVFDQTIADTLYASWSEDDGNVWVYPDAFYPDGTPSSWYFEFDPGIFSYLSVVPSAAEGTLSGLTVGSSVKVTDFKVKYEVKNLAFNTIRTTGYSGDKSITAYAGDPFGSGTGTSSGLQPIVYKEGSGSTKRVTIAENGIQVKSTDGYAAIGDITAGNNVAEFWGDIQIAGDVASTTVSTLAASSFSDKRLKDNISAIESPVDLVNKLNPVKYDWKASVSNRKDLNVSLNEKYGFLAQEIEKVLPTAILKNKNSVNGVDRPLSVEYNNIIAINTAAIKELIESVNDLKEEIKTLKENNG